MLGAEKDRLIPVDGEVFNMVVKGWYGILIGKTRKRNKKKDTKDKSCVLYIKLSLRMRSEIYNVKAYF